MKHLIYCNLYLFVMADLFNDALKYALRESNRDGLRIKEEQFEALKTIVVERNDTVCVLPTGYGKSLIYQLAFNF